MGLPYCPDEKVLRDSIRGTVWEPGMVGSFPGVMSRSELFGNMGSIFEDYKELKDSISNCGRNVPEAYVSELQTFWVFSQLRGVHPLMQGPEWRSLRHKSEVSAAFGLQRASSFSLRGISRLFPSGLGPIRHMEAALKLPSPFQRELTPDTDLAFAAYAIQVWGPYFSRWREKMISITHKISKALEPAEKLAVNLMHPDVKLVAKDRKPVSMALLVCLLRWPDRKLPIRFLEGFKVIGHLDHSGIFNDKQMAEISEEVLQESFLASLQRSSSTTS